MRPISYRIGYQGETKHQLSWGWSTTELQYASSGWCAVGCWFTVGRAARQWTWIPSFSFCCVVVRSFVGTASGDSKSKTWETGKQTGTELCGAEPDRTGLLWTSVKRRTGWDKRKGATGLCFGLVLFWLWLRNSSVVHESDITIIEHPQSEGAKGKEQERKREHQLFLLRAS